MPLDRPRRTAATQLTPQIRQAIFAWIKRYVDGGVAGLVKLYLEEEVHPNHRDALIELEDRYGLEHNRLLDHYIGLLLPLGEQRARNRRPRGAITIETREDLVGYVPDSERAVPFLHCLPEPELLTALEAFAGTHPPVHRDAGAADLFGYLDKVFQTCGLPYTASPGEGIRWVGEPAVREHAIEPALMALADHRLITARQEFDKARLHLRRGELKDAGKAGGDAVETTMAILLDSHAHPQPQTQGGHDLVQAGALFDALKSKRVGLLDHERDYALIFGPIKVRHACGHGGGAKPKPLDPSYVEAGVAGAGLAITYLASKFP